MYRRGLFMVFMLFSSLVLSACGEKLELEVKARMDGQPVPGAKVAVDGETLGATDANGVLTKIIRKKPGAEVELVVSKEMSGYRIQPWKTTFLMKLPKQGMDRYSFDAELAATRYVTIVATDKGTPLPEAEVKAFGKEIGKTDAKGEFIYEYTSLPKGGADLVVTKSGYTTWKKTGDLTPGSRIEASLSRRVGTCQEFCVSL